MTTSLGGTKLGGGFNGISPKQTVLNYKDGEQAMTRRLLRSAWNTKQAAKVLNGYDRNITPFRAVNNSGDYLARQNYVCGGPNPTHRSRGGIRHRFGSIISNCDDTNIEAANTNVKYVPDSSDYIRYKKQNAMNNNYNDNSFGGYNNSAYTNIMAIRR
tara:strand:+ start:917 stop:1390 length:474 start_codon:yes stop_codon:yes gene_type:complete